MWVRGDALILGEGVLIPGEALIRETVLIRGDVLILGRLVVVVWTRLFLCWMDVWFTTVRARLGRIKTVAKQI